MATEKAVITQSHLTDIANAIIAKGGAAGPLKPSEMKAAIEAIPTGSEPPKQWWEDQDLTVIEITLYDRDTTFKDSSVFPTGTKIWWDCSKGAESYVTKPSSTALEHDYGSAGTYLVAFSNSTSNLQSAFYKNLKISGLKKIASGVKNMRTCFEGCTCLKGDIPSLKSVTSSLYGAFDNASVSPNVINFPDVGGVSAYAGFRGFCSSGTLVINGKVENLWLGDIRINRLIAPDLNHCPLLHGANRLVECIIPNATEFENNGLYYASRLSYAKFGTLVSFGATGALSNVGGDLTADANGFKAIIEVGNTCASLMGLTYFPASAPLTTKFVCSDGYVAYINGAWTAVTEE